MKNFRLRNLFLTLKRYDYTPIQPSPSVKKYSQRIGRLTIGERVTHAANGPRFREANPRSRLFEKKVLEKKSSYAAVSSYFSHGNRHGGVRHETVFLHRDIQLY
jgi:hypothetical protein